jgi:hypothetical protein
MRNSIKSGDTVTLINSHPNRVIKDDTGRWITTIKPVRRGEKGLQVKGYRTSESAFIPEGELSGYVYA